MTTQPSTGPRPRTEAGRDLLTRYFSGDGYEANVAAIEAEARAAALTAVEEAVRSAIFDLPIGVNVDYSRGYSAAVAADREAVLAVLTELQEDALHPADKEAETSHE